MARRLAERFDLPVYSADAAIGVHSRSLSAAEAPLLAEFRRMSMDQRWVRRDTPTMYQTFPWFHGEGFDLLIKDLRAFPVSGVVLAEGFRLLPRLVRPYLANQRHAVWLLPTPQFRRTAFIHRGQRDAFWLRTSDPARALANLLGRDRIFNDAVAADAASNRLTPLVVDGSRSIEDEADDLAARFELLQ